MKHVTFVLFLMILFFSCKKYPEDEQKPHFRKPEKRIGNKCDVFSSFSADAWFPYSFYLKNGNKELEIPGGNHRYHVNFYASRKHANTVICGDSIIPFIFYSTFEFFDKKKSIRLFKKNGEYGDFEIRRLDCKTLWLRNDTANFIFHKNTIRR